MANDGFTQQALAADPHFRQRIRASLSSVAWEVLAEDPATPNHANRIAYAHQVTRQLDSEVVIILPQFVMRPNVLGAVTSYAYDFELQAGQVVTAATDADLTSQLHTDFDEMAAAAGFGA